MQFNGMKTALLLGGMSGLLMLLGEIFGGRSGLQMAFVFAIVMNFASYFFSEKIALMMYQAQPVTPDQNGHVYARIFPMVEPLCGRRLWLPSLFSWRE